MSTLEISETMAMVLEEEAQAEGVSQTEILEEAFKHYRRVIHQRRLESALKWYTLLPEQERMVYAGKYVAVYQCTIVDSDSNRLALYQRIRARYGNKAVLIIPAEGPQEFNLINTRIESL